MATYQTHTTINSASVTDIHTCGQDEELVSIRIVAQSTTAEQSIEIVKQIASGGPTDYSLGWVKIPAVASVLGTNGNPHEAVFVSSKCYMVNTDKIRIKSENTDAFDIHVVTRDPVV